MKTSIRYICLFALWLIPYLVSASTYDLEADGIYYKILDDSRVEVTSGSTKYSGDVIIPESVEYNETSYSVTSIGERAFKDCTGLTSVTIPNSVTSIGDYALSGCSGLTSVTIPNSVTYIGNYAFNDCNRIGKIILEDGPNSLHLGAENGNAYGKEGLFYSCSLVEVYLGRNLEYDKSPFKSQTITKLTIGNSVTSIGNYAFDSCRKLTSVTIPSSVKSIGKDAFIYCSGLKEVHISSMESWCNIAFQSGASNPLCYTHNLYLDDELVKDLIIPESVSEIKYRAFYGCTSLTSVTIPNSVTSIGDYAFYNCDHLSYITIPNSVTSIGNYAFDLCSRLSFVSIGESVETIGNCAFSDCDGLTSVTIPNSVTSIGSSAFKSCYGLTSVTIGKSVKTIDDQAFDYCHRLTSVSIPNSVTYIGKNAFRECGLSKVVFEDGTKSLTINYSYSDFSGDVCQFYRCPLKEVYLGRDLKYDESPFEGHTITKLTIGNSVTSIGDYAFCRCTGLTSITIPNSVTSIGNSAFYKCIGLTSVTIGESVKTIGSSAFSNCTGLTSVTIPNSVTSIDSYAFSGCSGLKKIILEDGTNTLSVGNNNSNSQFCDCPLEEVYLGRNLEYDKSPFLNQTITKLTISNSVTTIGSSAFNGCNGLTSVTIPNSVTFIGYGAFSGCYSLEDVYISSLDSWCNIIFKSYDSNPLYYANNLYLNGELVTDLIIPESVSEIKDYAFNGYSNLNSVIIGESVESIGVYVVGVANNLLIIKSLAPIPPFIYYTSFNSDIYKTATLEVLPEALNAYKEHPVWSRFLLIQDLSALDDIENPDDDFSFSVDGGSIHVNAREGAKIDIYNMGGNLVRSTTDQTIDGLIPGIYILRHASKSHKLLIK